MFKDLKGIMSKELKECMRMMVHQIGNLNKEIKIMKKNQIEILEL